MEETKVLHLFWLLGSTKDWGKEKSNHMDHLFKYPKS